MVPVASQNSQTTREVMDGLTEVHTDGTTLLLVTHDPTCAARAERVVYLRDGRLDAECTLGRWSEATARDREGELLSWLTGLGF